MRNDYERPSKKVRDDIYLITSIIVSIGVVMTAVLFSEWPFLISLCAAALVWWRMVSKQIDRDHEIQKIREVGAVDVQKIEAAKKPSNVIEGQAVQKFPNFMGPVAQIEAPKWTKVIQNDATKIVVRRKWMWMLNNGEEARGDLIEAIVAAAFTPKDEKEDLRDFIRRKYRIEFGNAAYTKACKALQEVRAVDSSQNWLIECDAADALLEQMRNQSQPIEAT